MNLRTTLAKAVAASILTAGALLAAPAAPASAYPYAGPDQSLYAAYYEVQSGVQVLVGESMTGDCGEDYAWGVKTDIRYYEVFSCPPPPAY
jgi:hypothetical protein